MCFTNYSSIKKIKKIKIRGSCFPISISDRGRYFTHCRVISSEIAVSVSAPLRVVVTSPTLVLFFQRWLLIFLLSASQRVVVASPTVVLFHRGTCFLVVISHCDRYVTNISTRCNAISSEIAISPSASQGRGRSLLCYFFRGPCFPIIISSGDRHFTNVSTRCMEFVRSHPVPDEKGKYPSTLSLPPPKVPFLLPRHIVLT